MKNTPEAAIMYDMISYSVIYFNKSTAVEFLKRETGIPDEDTLLQAYREFSASCHLEVPPNVYPFFYFNGTISCPLSKMWSDYFKTYQQYRQQICNIHAFKSFIIKYFFENLVGEEDTEKIIKGDGETIARSLSLLTVSLHLDANLVPIFSNICYHFADLVKSLLAYLDRLQVILRQYHVKRMPQSNRILREFFSNEDQQNLFRKSYELEENIRLKEQVYSICYIQPYVQTFSTRDKREYVFLFGYLMLHCIEDRIHYGYINAVHALQVFGKVYTHDVLECLKSGNKTISQIARIMHISRTSISRLIYVLADELVLKSYKKEIYYELNYEYLKHARTKIIRYLDELLLNGYNNDRD